MSSCIHHWRIETPNGRRELPAQCVKCKASRMFATPDNEPSWATERIGRAERLPVAS
jgi:hypothetical protein